MPYSKIPLLKFSAVIHFLLILQGCVSSSRFNKLNSLNKELLSKIDSLKNTGRNNYYFFKDDSTQFYSKNIDSLNLNISSLNKQYESLNTVIKKLTNNSSHYNNSEFSDYIYTLKGDKKNYTPAKITWGISDLQKYNYSDSWQFDNYYKKPIFPFPPPKSTSRMQIPDSYFNNIKSLNGIDSILKLIIPESALKDYSYCSLEDNNGFAILSSIDEYNYESGNCESQRLVQTTKSKGFFDVVADAVKALFFENKGHYRMCVFIVTDTLVSGSSEKINLTTANDYYKIGFISSTNLPNTKSTENPKKPSNYHCYFYVYEFVKTENNKNPECVSESKYSAQEHLKGLKIFQK